MALDFPNSPTTGQTYSGPGGEVWSWDGTKWIQAAGSSFPSGTVAVFYQAAAPVGWTQVTTHNDKLLRVVNTAGGGSGGSNSFSSVNAQTVVGNHTLAAAELPSISSSGTSGLTTFYPNNNSGYYVPMTPNTGWASSTGTGPGSGSYNEPYTTSSITYTNSFQGTVSLSSTSSGTSGNAHNHPITMSILYIDLLLASKN